MGDGGTRSESAVYLCPLSPIQLSGQSRMVEQENEVRDAKKWTLDDRRDAEAQRATNADHARLCRVRKISTCLRHAPPSLISLR